MKSEPPSLMKPSINKWTFLIIILAAIVFGALTFSSSKSHFEASCEKIQDANRQFCESLPSMIQKFHNDSVRIDVNSLEASINISQDRINSMLALQHAEIQEDFSNLMLWAAVLMVIFLVFSIYSMYKIDELVAQSRNSVNQVTTLADNAENKIRDIDTLFNNESKKLVEQSLKEIENLNKASQDKLQSLQEEINKLMKESEGKISRDIEESEKRFTDTINQYNEAIKSKEKNVVKRFNELKNFIETLKDIFNPPSKGE